MSDPIESVKGERRRQYGLGGVLDCLREPGNSLQHMRRVESPRSGEVCQEVAVHHCSMLGAKDRDRRAVLTNAETNAGESVSNGRDPCQLRLVDGKVRRRGATETLFVQNILGCI